MRITQLTYDEFKENIDELISQYRENFSGTCIHRLEGV